MQTAINVRFDFSFRRLSNGLIRYVKTRTLANDRSSDDFKQRLKSCIVVKLKLALWKLEMKSCNLKFGNVNLIMSIIEQCLWILVELKAFRNRYNCLFCCLPDTV